MAPLNVINGATALPGGILVVKLDNHSGAVNPIIVRLVFLRPSPREMDLIQPGFHNAFHLQMCNVVLVVVQVFTQEFLEETLLCRV